MPEAPGPRRPVAAGRGQAGFTLVELLVSLSLLLLVLLLACQLLLESARLYRHSALQALDSDPGLTEAWLRQDLRGAVASPAGTPGLWRREPLDLPQPEGRQVRWGLDEAGRLQRQWQQGGSWRSRPTLRDVRRWRWRVVAAPLPLVEVEVTFARPGGSWTRAQTARRPAPASSRLEALQIVALPRGGGGTAW